MQYLRNRCPRSSHSTNVEGTATAAIANARIAEAVEPTEIGAVDASAELTATRSSHEDPPCPGVEASPAQPCEESSHWEEVRTDAEQPTGTQVEVAGCQVQPIMVDTRTADIDHDLQAALPVDLVLTDASAAPTPHRMSRLLSLAWTPASLAKTPPMKFQDVSLLRAAPSCRVLHGFAEVFSARLGVAEDYNVSGVSDHIDCFITHNWVVGRFSKFTVLTIHFNTKPALMIVTLYCVAATCLTVLGYLPVFDQIGLDSVHKQGAWCLAFGLLVFWLSVLVWHEVMWLIGRKSPSVFVDKCCIHQTDPDLKVQGIKHLSAYLQYSWSVVVCYTNIYFKKLWTMYEVASFLTLQPGGRMKVIPVVLPTVLFAVSWLDQIAFVLIFLTSMPSLGDDVSSMVPLTFHIIYFVAVMAFICILRRWAEERHQMFEISQQFRVADAVCSIESDRAAVQTNIVALMKHFGHVPADASQLEALEFFEGLVHAEVPRFFAASLGRVGVPYEYVLIMSLPMVLWAFDVLAGYVVEGFPARTICSRLLYDLTIGLASTPLLLAALPSKLAELSLKLSRGRLGGLCCCFGIAIVTTVFAAGNDFLLRSLSDNANVSDLFLGVFVLYAGVLYLLTFSVYRPLAYTRHRKRFRPSRLSA